MPNVSNRIIYTAVTACLLLSTQAQASDPFREEENTTTASSTCSETNEPKPDLIHIAAHATNLAVPESDWIHKFAHQVTEDLKNKALSEMQSGQPFLKLDVTKFERKFDFGQFIRIEEKEPTRCYSQQFCSAPIHRVYESAGGPPPKPKYHDLFPKEEINLVYPKEKFISIEPLYTPRVTNGPVHNSVQAFINKDSNRAERENLIIRLVHNSQDLNVCEQACVIVGLNGLFEKRKREITTVQKTVRINNITFDDSYKIKFDKDSNSESTFTQFPIEILGTIFSITPEEGQLAVAYSCKTMLKKAFELNTFKVIQIAKEIRVSYLPAVDSRGLVLIGDDSKDPIWKEICTIKKVKNAKSLDLPKVD